MPERGYRMKQMPINYCYVDISSSTGMRLTLQRGEVMWEPNAYDRRVGKGMSTEKQQNHAFLFIEERKCLRGEKYHGKTKGRAVSCSAYDHLPRE